MRVLAFTGMPGAGKSEAVEEARRRGLPVVSMGDFVRAAVREQRLEPTDENVGRVATAMRKEHGPDYWAQRTADRIEREWKDRPLVVIDGVRTLAEVKAFRARLGSAFHLVAIDAPFEVRAERLRLRGRSDDAKDKALVEKRDEREKGWGIEQAIASADTHIRNTPPLSDFRKRIDTLFEELMRPAGPASGSGARGASSGTRP
ncbi:MAG: flagellar hook-basal body complex protein FliE [Euryarchaeota archaeon]|nr:flagellar hook-basal body complex protein FliE [Euryarchaeota archaeon]